MEAQLLDRIRETEAALVGQMAAAGEQATAALAAAHDTAKALIARGEAGGREQGVHELEAAIRQAQQEAEAIRTTAREQAALLFDVSSAAKARAVAHAVAVVIGEVT